MHITPTLARPRFLALAVCLLLLVGVSLRGQKDNDTHLILVVPYAEFVQDLSTEERIRLEDAMGGDIEKMLAAGLIHEGDMLDMGQPHVRFSYEFNKWVRLKAASLKRHVIDVKEIEQWEKVREAWREMDKRVVQLHRLE